MAHYALINNQNIVVSVIVSDEDPINIEHLKKQAEDVSGRWLQTSYNTRGNVHYNPDGSPSGQPGLRKNYAGINFTYSDELDAFLPPKPYSSWILDENNYFWKAPIDQPLIVETGELTDRRIYVWKEETQSWNFAIPNEYEPMKYTLLNHSGSIISDSSPTQVKSI